MISEILVVSLTSLCSTAVSHRSSAPNARGHGAPPVRQRVPPCRGLLVNEHRLQVVALVLPRGASVLEETAAERVQAVREGSVVERVALLRAGDVVVMDKAEAVEVLLVGPLSVVQRSKIL